LFSLGIVFILVAVSSVAVDEISENHYQNMKQVALAALEPYKDPSHSNEYNLTQATRDGVSSDYLVFLFGEDTVRSVTEAIYSQPEITYYSIYFRQPSGGAMSSGLWVLIVAGIVEIWQGWRLSHPKSNAKKIMKE